MHTDEHSGSTNPFPYGITTVDKLGRQKRKAMHILLRFGQTRWLKELYTGMSNFDLPFYSTLHIVN